MSAVYLYKGDECKTYVECDEGFDGVELEYKGEVYLVAVDYV